MQLVMRPQQYDVVVTENLYGDILSDLMAGLIGGLGLVPGANLGDDVAIFEAVHGSAPDIAGQGIANPTAILLAFTDLLDHISLQADATRLRDALNTVLSDAGNFTPRLRRFNNSSLHRQGYRSLSIRCGDLTQSNDFDLKMRPAHFNLRVA